MPSAAQPATRALPLPCTGARGDASPTSKIHPVGVLPSRACGPRRGRPLRGRTNVSARTPRDRQTMRDTICQRAPKRPGRPASTRRTIRRDEACAGGKGCGSWTLAVTRIGHLRRCRTALRQGYCGLAGASRQGAAAAPDRRLRLVPAQAPTRRRRRPGEPTSSRSVQGARRCPSKAASSRPRYVPRRYPGRLLPRTYRSRRRRITTR